MPKNIKLLVTRQFPQAVLDRAAADYDSTFNPSDENWTGDALLARLEGHDAVMFASGNKFDVEVIAKVPDSIKMLATYSVGYEHIDVDAANARGLVVTNTPGVLSAATADIAFMLLLCASRRAGEADRMVRNGNWTGWTPTQMLGVGMQDKRLAILGMGGIGRQVAARGRAFGMDIHYHNRSRLAPDLEQGAVYHETPESLLKVAEFLSINCPMTPDMVHFLNAERIAQMPDGAIVANSARGGLIHDRSLIAALKSGKIYAAGLDVFDGEPNIDPEYKTLENVFMLPHVGSATLETRNAMGFTALDNLDAFFAGKEPPNRLS
ncbi:MAG: D-glycerate dehydrogenase [Rhodospirillaceae bacterium]